jgi:8-amino-7-oxononanoate synthase
MLDDAHGFGVLGAHGRGVLEHFGLNSPRIIYMATLGKAAGVAGAFVAGDPILVEYLSQQARTYIYTTAMPPPLAGALLASLRLIEQDAWRRAHLARLCSLLRGALQLRNWRLMESDTAIQPVVIGSNNLAVAASKHLLESGILVPAIRPPTVPRGTARLRISLSAMHTESDVRQLASAIQSAETALA